MSTILKDYNLSSSSAYTKSIIREAISNDSVSSVFVVNAQIFCHGIQNSSYQKLINSGVINTCDGINVRRLVKWTEKKRIELYPGPDLFEDLVIKSELGTLKHAFIGGSEKVSNGLKNRLGTNNKLYFSPPFVIHYSMFDFENIARIIEEFKADIVWIGLGAPKQEYFIQELKKYLTKGVIIGVGAAFNFHSGIPSLRRAPRIWRNLKLEWMFRLMQEPKRIFKRQFKNFFLLIKGYIRYS